MTPLYLALGAALTVSLLALAVRVPERWPELGRGVRGRLGALLAWQERRRERRRVRARHARRWEPEEEQALYEVLQDMADRIRAGEVADEALEAAVRRREGRLGAELRRAVRRHQQGISLPLALHEVAGPEPVLRQLGETLAIVEETGGNLGRALEQLLEGFHARRHLAGLLRIRTAEARYALQFMAVLPALLVIYLLAAHPHLLVPLWAEPTGRWSTLYAVVSWIAGIWVMRRLVAPEGYV